MNWHQSIFDSLSISHIYGAVDFDFNENQAVVLCVVKNGESWINEFIEYYTRIGFSHIIFLDNGSTDATVPMMCIHDNVTVLQSLSDFKKNKLKFKHALLKTFGVGTWSLTVDIDEFFQYPDMEKISLHSLLKYLNRNKYTTLVAHMLDLVPPVTLKELRDNQIRTIHDSKWYFNDSNIVKMDYNIPNNRINNQDIKLWYGGARKSIFGLSHAFLTKHPLNFGSGNITFKSSHTIGRRNVADISGLLLHYKFVGDVYSRTKEAVKQKNYYRDSIEYQSYLNAFENDESKNMLEPASVLYKDNHELMSRELFVTSDSYKNTRT